ncbi:alpha-L-fucosidase [uncultured Anaerococcus sp.]|uniref:alpha-L-fucosidase n=1 Tax=uncultured Anaerococcus sp. TaxID=293428 RepID=UPI0025E097D5|nr:alpha-L-fucosidase [uncultured Anaerococcus sp.]
MKEVLDKINKRTEWFRESRFGMFIHWGLYSIPGRGEWVRSHESIELDEYNKFLEQFNPVDYNPKEWAKAAKKAGMKYMVLTAKHHDGFCLFDSKYTDYKSTNTPAKRDLVKEYVEAVREEGLRVGLYFSLIDWSHKDYPKYNDRHGPFFKDERYKDEVIDFDNYRKFLHNQIEEIVTNYGKLDILWFDFSYDDMVGEKWGAKEIVEMVRKHQPDVVMDNRLETSGGGFGSMVTENPSEFCGDFVSPEQIIPYEGIKNVNGEDVPWELCLTMNNNWGYNPTDKEYKSSKVLIRKLVECVSKNGNMILNVGPTAKGYINEESLSILNDFNKWFEKNSESIYGCGKSDLPKPDWGYYTQKDNVVYAHVLEQPIGPLPLIGLSKDQIKYMTFLHDGSEVGISNSWTTRAFVDLTFAQLGPEPSFTYTLPDSADTVIKIVLNDK